MTELHWYKENWFYGKKLSLFFNKYEYIIIHWLKKQENNNPEPVWTKQITLKMYRIKMAELLDKI